MMSLFFWNLTIEFSLGFGNWDLAVYLGFGFWVLELAAQLETAPS